MAQFISTCPINYVDIAFKKALFGKRITNPQTKIGTVNWQYCLISIDSINQEQR